MTRKKKKKKTTVFGIVEGDRERAFLTTLIEIYNPRKNNISPFISPARGGKPDTMINNAFIRCDRNRCFVWFDEDFESVSPICVEIKEKLATHWKISEEKIQSFMNCSLKDMQSEYNPRNRNPILIISQPVCVESLIILTLGGNPPCDCFDPNKRDEQIKSLKDHLGNHIFDQCCEVEYYKNNLTREILEEKRKTVRELHLLISMITK